MLREDTSSVVREREKQSTDRQRKTEKDKETESGRERETERAAKETVKVDSVMERSLVIVSLSSGYRPDHGFVLECLPSDTLATEVANQYNYDSKCSMRF